MVDNSTFRFSKKMTLTDFKSYIKLLKANHYVSYQSNTKNSEKICFLVCKEDYNQELKQHSIKLTVEYFYSETINITIRGSLRKWYFSSKSTQDFSIFTFKDCLKLLSERIFLDYDDLCKFIITILELGVTLRLDSKYKIYIVTLLEHQRLKNRHSINNETIMFDGTNMCLKFYDKSKEIYIHTDLKKKAYEKISERYFILRIELKFKKISGVDFAKENLQTINQLLENWEEALEYVFEQIKKVKTIDFITPEIFSKLQDGTAKDFFDWLTFTGVKHIGLDRLWITLNDITERPHSIKKKLEMIVDEYKKINSPNFNYTIRKELRRKRRLIVGS